MLFPFIHFCLCASALFAPTRFLLSSPISPTAPLLGLVRLSLHSAAFRLRFFARTFTVEVSFVFGVGMGALIASRQASILA